MGFYEIPTKIVNATKRDIIKNKAIKTIPIEVKIKE